MKLFDDIKRRKVIQGVIAYAVAGWLILQLAIALESSLELPSYVDRYVTIAVIAGFPIAILVSWFFDISFGGVKAAEIVDAAAETHADTVLPIPRGPVTKNSIAVLPFVDMSPDKDQGYLGDGVAEEILNALVQVTPLNVSGRTSSFSFKHKDVGIKEIGEALSVVHVLEGSVRKQGDRVRITAQLIKADDGFHVWSETYNGDLKDIFDLQDSIAKAIVTALEVVLDVNQVRLVSRRTNSQEAYDLYLQSNKAIRKPDKKGALDEGIKFLNEAVTLDPKFVEAWNLLAWANFMVLEHTPARDWKSNFDEGRIAANSALQLDKKNPLSFTSTYYLACMNGRFGDAVDQAYEGYCAFPNRLDLKFLWGNALAAIGLAQQGATLMDEVVTKDPMSAPLFPGTGQPYWALGDVEKAKALYLRGFELGYDGGGISYAWLLSHTVGRSAALAFFKERFDAFGSVVKRYLHNPLIRFVYTRAVFGRRKWARSIAVPIMKQVWKDKSVPPSNAGSISAYYFGATEYFFDIVRKKPHPYLSSALMQIWLPTPEAKAIRTHKDFPRFALDIGLVQAWQTYGWPRWVTPKPGTDGSDLQFTVT